MARWYSKITADPVNFHEALGNALEHFHNEYELAQKELRPKPGSRIIDLSTNLAGIVEYRYGQLQELESILKFLEIQYDRVKGEKKRNFFEHYNRQLSERLSDQYAEIEPEVILLREFIQQVALIRNMFLGISKGLETLHFQIGHIIQLRKNGIEDATF
jgi:hypothetical protein